MTAPIRDMAGLVDELRNVQVAQNVSYQTIEHITGMPSGSVAKYLGSTPSKKLGPLSTFDILFALGKALTITDDPKAIAEVRQHWKPRSVRGGATLQMRARSAVLASALSIEEQRRQRMQELGRKGGKMGGSKGGKRRLKTMSKRARQRVAQHAARKRWAKRLGSAPELGAP